MLTLNRCMQALALCAAFAALPAAAETPQDILDGFTVEAKTEAPDFQGLSLPSGPPEARIPAPPEHFSGPAAAGHTWPVLPWKIAWKWSTTASSS